VKFIVEHDRGCPRSQRAVPAEPSAAAGGDDTAGPCECGLFDELAEILRANGYHVDANRLGR
jgi:hypothetical protein